ncbi:MAG: DinB family protein [Bacteroidetes bacterium]|nr:DinB family protein [Bacteroidota bacterium]
MSKKELVQQLEDAYTSFLEALARVPAGKIDTVPFEGSWTAGQLAEHIIKAGFSAGDFLRNNVQPTTDRPADAGVPMLRSIFLDFDTKLHSPDFLVPQESRHDKTAQLAKLESIKTEYIDVVNEVDLSYTCLGSKMPGGGYMTRLEWVSLNIFHTQRHARQMQRIAAVLNGEKTVPA